MRPFRALTLLGLGATIGEIGSAIFVKHAFPSRGDADSDEIALVAVFDGVQLASRASAFRGGSVVAWYGGVELDLREATLAPDARLTVHAALGGVAIRVPPEWRIESSLNALAGGVDVKGADPEGDGPTLAVDGFALFGGVAIGSKKPAEG
jgi:hypothetical protein